jgi:PH (Pleckstrin Homology) domain-containing protein
MVSGPWWLHALAWIAWWLLFLIAAALLMRIPAGPHHAGELRYSRSTLVVGVVCSGFFVAVAALSVMFPGRNPSLGPTVVFLVCALFSAPLILEYFRVWYRLEPEGLRYRPLVKRRGFLRWTNVRRVGYSPSLHWFHIETADGAGVRLSTTLVGLPEFARAVLDEVPAERIEAGARRVLAQIVALAPPR